MSTRLSLVLYMLSSSISIFLCQRQVKEGKSIAWLPSSSNIYNDLNSVYQDDYQYSPIRYCKLYKNTAGKSDDEANFSPEPKGFEGRFAPKSQSKLGKLIGGAEVNYMIPWQVSVQQRKFLQKEQAYCWGQLCGGILIHSQWVLTAAHCLRPSRVIGVRVGSLNYKSGGEFVMVDKQIQHENYDSYVKLNDIGLLKLQKEVTYTPVPLPSIYDQLNLGSNCYIMGWGREENNFIPDMLRITTVPIVDFQSCANIYRFETDQERQICAGYENGQADACHGDSGGPLICANPQGYIRAYGIISYGEPCVRSTLGVYTSLAYYTDWINSWIEASRTYGSNYYF